MSDDYVIENTEHTREVMLFWAPNRCGYTTDLDRAGRYTKEQAESQHRLRETDIPRRLADLVVKAKRTVEREYVPRPRRRR